MDLFHALLYAGTLPALSHVLIASAWTVSTLTVGTILFRRRARHLVEDL